MSYLSCLLIFPELNVTDDNVWLVGLIDRGLISVTVVFVLLLSIKILAIALQRRKRKTKGSQTTATSKQIEKAQDEKQDQPDQTESIGLKPQSTTTDDTATTNTSVTTNTGVTCTTSAKQIEDESTTMGANDATSTEDAGDRSVVADQNARGTSIESDDKEKQAASSSKEKKSEKVLNYIEVDIAGEKKVAPRKGETKTSRLPGRRKDLNVAYSTVCVAGAAPPSITEQVTLESTTSLKELKEGRDYYDL